MIFGIFRVSGHSMLPAFKPNEGVLASSLPFLFAKPKVRDVVLFRYNDKMLIKRIVRIENERYYIKGDNKSDSMKMEPISRNKILGKVLLTISAKG